MQWVQSLGLGLRAAFFVLFLVAAGSKVRSDTARRGFVRWVADLGLVPDRMVAAVAWATIGVEGLIVVLLVTPWAAVAFGLAALVLGGFAIATALVVRRGTTARCLCFGASPAVLGRRHVVRDGVLAATAAVGVGVGGAALPPVAGIVVAGAAGCSIALAVVLLDEFFELFSV
jgi:hypothetical protein